MGMPPKVPSASDGRTVGRALPNDDTAPGEARREVKRTLALWHLPEVIDDAVLAASELVTNAVLHGLPPIGMRLRRRVGLVRLDVDDARPETTSRPQRSVEPAESGRGLDIVRQVSDHMGITQIAGKGKCIYAAWDITEMPPGDSKPGDATEPPTIIAS
ncbi:MAG: putative regulatory protein [Frankiales bacterium]|nr:putative regulatory protein [Frankiales bacterium]